MADNCPECGNKFCTNINLVGDGYRECLMCGQEWWTDLTYPKSVPAVDSTTYEHAVTYVRLRHLIKAPHRPSPDCGAVLPANPDYNWDDCHYCSARNHAIKVNGYEMGNAMFPRVGTFNYEKTPIIKDPRSGE